MNLVLAPNYCVKYGNLPGPFWRSISLEWSFGAIFAMWVSFRPRMWLLRDFRARIYHRPGVPQESMAESPVWSDTYLSCCVKPTRAGW